MIPKPITLALCLCDYVIVEESTKKQFTLLVDGDWIAQRRLRVHIAGG